MDHFSHLPILEIRSLWYSYTAGGEVLRGLNLEVRRGSRLAVLGPNGAGKSTLFLHMNGTLRPKSGEVRFDGEAVDYGRAGRQRWRKQVGLVFQNPDDQLFAPTVWEDISFGPLNQALSPKEVEERVEGELARFGISGLRDRAPWSLSQGEKRRVALAGVLAMRPRVLVLDEPSSGLDHLGISQLLLQLETINREGVTIVMATHDLELAASWADEVALISAGAIVRQGRVADVFTDQPALAQSGLSLPLVIEIAERLRRLGLIDQHGDLPHSREELFRSLDQLEVIDGGSHEFRFEN